MLTIRFGHAQRHALDVVSARTDRPYSWILSKAVVHAATTAASVDRTSAINLFSEHTLAPPASGQTRLTVSLRQDVLPIAELLVYYLNAGGAPMSSGVLVRAAWNHWCTDGADAIAEQLGVIHPAAPTTYELRPAVSA
ncbi:MAG: hypothetical protein L0H59_07720 [Tomitella sp.]|nr:hypothetical protein [Tomitella sp.]